MFDDLSKKGTNGIAEEEAEDATIVEEETAKTESDSEQNDNTDSEEKSE